MCVEYNGKEQPIEFEQHDYDSYWLRVSKVSSVLTMIQVLLPFQPQSISLHWRNYTYS